MRGIEERESDHFKGMIKQVDMEKVYLHVFSLFYPFSTFHENRHLFHAMHKYRTGDRGQRME